MDLGFAAVCIAIILGPWIGTALVTWAERRTKTDPRVVKELAELHARLDQAERTIERMEREHQ